MYIPSGTYEQQRQNRLQESIDEYLNDEDVSPQKAYEDLLSCTDDVINYHKKMMNRAVELKSYMMGHRPVDLDDERKREDDRRAYEELQDLWYRTDAELAEYKDNYHKVVNELMNRDNTDKESLSQNP